jgi:hypothetical protein
MSGSFAAAAVGLVDTALSLFGAGNQPVTLGDFIFAGYEVPESIRWGGNQSLSIKKLPGGQRVIDDMGPDDADIPWSGIFLSSDASDRADQLKTMKDAGVQYDLVFAGRMYTVLIRSFRADQRKINHVPYSIVCTVLQDLTGAGGPTDSPSMLSQVTDDLNSALGFDVPATLSAVQNQLQTVTPLLVPLVSLVGGTSAATSIAAGLGTTQGLLSSADTLAEGNIAGLTTAAATVGNVVGATTAQQANANTNAAATNLATAAAAQAMSAYVGRAAVNVSNA